MRIAMGNRDLENGTLEVARRDTFEKQTVSRDEVVEVVTNLLEEIQKNIFNKALTYRNEHTTEVNSFEEFKEVIENKGGFVSAHWDGTIETEEKIKTLTKATIRCIPNNAKEEKGVCVLTGKPSTKRVLFAKAY
ncbi:Proline--tRNA ligase (fragment) [Tenacibaculum sediminilitoris]